jgi:quercetin dioxygenase-like cupin family protein
LLTFDLKGEDRQLQERAATAKAGRAAKTLLKEGQLRATIVAIRKGVALQEHEVDGPVTIQVLRGRVSLETDGSPATGSAGALLTLDAGVRHRLTALADAAVLITMSVQG